MNLYGSIIHTLLHVSLPKHSRHYDHEPYEFISNNKFESPAGENALFECSLLDYEGVKVTWLKDNKPLTDRLMDRCSITSIDGNFKLLLMHCREDDAGTYTAIAENIKGNTHCTAQLAVQEREYPFFSLYLIELFTLHLLFQFQ